MRTITVKAPAVEARVNRRMQLLRVVAKIHRNTSLSILFNYGIGILCWAGLTLSAILMFVFGLFLMNGWSIVLSIALACVSSVIFTAKESYDEFSIKEAIEMLFTGKEVSK